MHVMFDTETLDTKTSGVVTQIGWCIFDINASKLGASGSVFLDPQEQMDRGRTVSWSTIKWWMQQDAEAIRRMVDAGRVSLNDALRLVDECVPLDLEGVWGHGATFDISILQSLYELERRPVPWPFKLVRDTRTLFAVKPNFKWPRNPLRHDAENDAIAQAGAVQNPYRSK